MKLEDRLYIPRPSVCLTPPYRDNRYQAKTQITAKPNKITEWRTLFIPLKYRVRVLATLQVSHVLE